MMRGRITVIAVTLVCSSVAGSAHALAGTTDNATIDRAIASLMSTSRPTRRLHSETTQRENGASSFG